LMLQEARPRGDAGRRPAKAEKRESQKHRPGAWNAARILLQVVWWLAAEAIASLAMAIALLSPQSAAINGCPCRHRCRR